MSIDLWVLLFAAANALIEFALGEYNRHGVRAKGELGQNIASTATFFVFSALYLRFVLFVFQTLAGPWKGALATASLFAVALAATILDDYVNYWVHRKAHEIPFLWRLHKPHHTTKHLNVSATLRGNVVYGFILPSSTTAPLLIFLGAPGAAMVVKGIKGVIGYASHANLRWDLWLYRRPSTRWLIVALEQVFVLQDFHHIHHGIGRYGNSAGNYGNVYSIWDRWHGTGKQVHHEQEAFGLPDDVTVEPWYVQTWWPLFRVREREDLRIPTETANRYSSIEIETARAVIITHDDRAIAVG